MARQETAKTIINRAAAELAITASADPYSSTDEMFTQLTSLLNTAGQELVELHPWQVLREEWEFTTDAVADITGIYDLPTDFGYMIDQAAWDKTNNVPIGGPLSGQVWSYLEGRGLTTSTIYASFRLAENKLEIYPQPPPDAITLRFEYISRNWAEDSGGTGKDWTDAQSDIVRLDPLLVQKFVKVKFLDSKGMDASAARMDFENTFNSRSGKDEGAGILSASGGRNGPHYLGWRNMPDTNYGS